MQKAALKARLERYPRLYLNLLRLQRRGHWSREWIVTKHSDITIEGFPRSANSFALSAFEHSQKEPCRIATHVHSYAQVIRSVQLGVPTMVLLRAPCEACVSFMALTYQIEDTTISEKMLQRAKPVLIGHLKNYRTFYENVRPLGNDVIVAEFKRVTTDFAEVIRRVNQRFGTNFGSYQDSPENRQAIFKEGGFHLSPDSKRDAIKATLRRTCELDEVQAYVEKAERCYHQMLALEAEQTKTFRYDG